MFEISYDNPGSYIPNRGGKEGREGGREGRREKKRQRVCVNLFVLFCDVEECVSVSGHKKSWLQCIFEGAKKKPVLVHTGYHTRS